MLAATLTFVLAATLLRGVPASAAPEQTGTEALNSQLHALNVRVRSSQYYRHVLLSSLLVAWSKKKPDRPEQEIVQEFLSVSELLDEQLEELGASPGGDPVAALGEISRMVGEHPELAPAAASLGAALRGFAATPAQQFDSWQNAVAANHALTGNAAAVLDEWGRAVAAGVRGMAATLGGDNPHVKVWDSRIGSSVGIGATATTEQLVANSGLDAVVDVRRILQIPQGDPGYRQEIEKQLAKLLGHNNDLVREAVQSIDKLQNGDDGAFQWKTDAPAAPPSAHDAALAEAKKRQEKIDQVKDGINVLAKLMERLDPNAAKQVAGVGTAAARIATAVNDYLPKIAGKSFGKAFFSMGTVALTGNIIGAISDLLPIFLGSPEPQLVQQLGKLRQEVANLHNAMNEQFSRVNETLNTIYGDMMGKFEQVLKLQRATAAQLTQIQGQLQNIQQSVDVWAAEIIKSLQNGALHSSREALNEYLGYERLHKIPIPTYGEYAGVINKVHYTAVTQTREEPFVPSPGNHQQHEANPVAVPGHL